MPVAERAGHTIHYEGIGDPSAPPLLLIMGMGLSSRAWESLPARLSERFRVLVFDNRGTGRSGRRGWMYRMRDLADDAVTVLDAVQVSQANVFGISMGGMIAQELAIRHPYRVRRLALGATFASWLRGDKPSLRTAFDLLLLILQRQRVPAERLGRLLVSREFHKANPTRACGSCAARVTSFRSSARRRPCARSPSTSSPSNGYLRPGGPPWTGATPIEPRPGACSPRSSSPWRGGRTW